MGHTLSVEGDGGAGVSIKGGVEGHRLARRGIGGRVAADVGRLVRRLLAAGRTVGLCPTERPESPLVRVFEGRGHETSVLAGRCEGFVHSRRVRFDDVEAVAYHLGGSLQALKSHRGDEVLGRLRRLREVPRDGALEGFDGLPTRRACNQCTRGPGEAPNGGGLARPINVRLPLDSRARRRVVVAVRPRLVLFHFAV